MKRFSVWIDRQEAKAFEFSDEKMDRKTFRETHNDHHTHHTDSKDHDRWSKGVFTQLATHLVDAEMILILGPGVAKFHFRSFLTEHHPALAKKIVGCETVDHPTDAQIAAASRNFFAPLTAGSR